MPRPKARPRNRAAQDATLINLRALKRRVKDLEQSLIDTSTALASHGRRLTVLERQQRENQQALEAVLDKLLEPIIDRLRKVEIAVEPGLDSR